MADQQYGTGNPNHPSNSGGVPQLVVNGNVSMDHLVAFYKEASHMRDEAFAKTIVAEAITSEATAVQNLALESTATLLASAVSKLAK